jgi:hypothetical protein
MGKYFYLHFLEEMVVLTNAQISAKYYKTYKERRTYRLILREGRREDPPETDSKVTQTYEVSNEEFNIAVMKMLNELKRDKKITQAIQQKQKNDT